ncbi:MAG: ABC transporter ATP-binding protein [Dehalococcoidales bacterium]|nr:ABC transporter ATP-binding protein [Dehalococcoidales bacterium]
MIHFKNFSFTYNGSCQPALSHVSLKINQGEFALICGKSGSGKTSLCRVINGLIPHFHGGAISGEIEVVGMDPIALSPGRMAVHAGMVFQDPENQLVASRVNSEICFGMENLGFERIDIEERLDWALQLLNIKHLQHRAVHELSGGEKQRVAIASVLALKPGILILDEPASSLDPAEAESLFRNLTQLNRELELTIIIIEHRLERVIGHANRVIVMEKGEILFNKPPASLVAENVKELPALGIRLPPVVQLYHALQAQGVELGKAPLSLEDSYKTFNKVFSKPMLSLPAAGRASRASLAVEMDEVSYSYKNGIQALNGISLRIDGGEVVAILGCNGSGKTTLAKLLNGLLKPASGTVKILGNDISGQTVAEVSENVGIIFQNPGDHLFAETVEEEIAFALKIKNAPEAEISARTTCALKRFNLLQYRHQNPLDLSNGEKQRLALASVAVCEPAILVLDEPDQGADEHSRQRLAEILSDYRAALKTVIMITHDVELASRTADRVILMEEGKIAIDDNKHEALSSGDAFSPQINRLVHRFKQNGVSSRFLTVEEVLAARHG